MYIVNLFYHCRAVYKIHLGIDLVWEIHLYPGNNPKWLLKNKMELLNFIQKQLGYASVRDIKVIVIDKI